MFTNLREHNGMALSQFHGPKTAMLFENNTKEQPAPFNYQSSMLRLARITYVINLK